MVGTVTRGIGSVLLLTGAFAVGGVLHRVFVEGTVGATSPVAVGGLALGVVLILAGKRLEGGRPTPPSQDTDEDEEGEDGGEDGSPGSEGDDAEFDERFSPVSEDDLQGRERDDDRAG